MSFEIPADVVLATHNAGKIEEWRELLGPLEAAPDLGLPEPDETEPDYIGNARIKARSAARLTGRPALAEDSGIELGDLQGAPGVSTARWIAARGGWTHALNAHLEEHGEGGGVAWATALCLAWPDGRERVAQDRLTGRLSMSSGQGPGVCPWFVPEGVSLTLAALGPAWRRLHGPRARALKRLLDDDP